MIETRVSDLAIPLQVGMEGLKDKLQAQDKRIIDLADRNSWN